MVPMIGSRSSRSRMDHPVDDDPDVEERDLFQRHEACEGGRRIIARLHVGRSDRVHQMVEGAQEDGHVEPDFAVEQAKRQALDDVGFVVFAGDHCDQVIALEAPGFRQNVGAGKQRRRLRGHPQSIEEHVGEIVGFSADRFPGRRDALKIALLEPDELLTPFDILRADVQYPAVPWI
jgi:hypothetical protein